MATIEFSGDEKKVIVGRIQAYFREELNQELGFFDAEFLLDFFPTRQLHHHLMMQKLYPYRRHYPCQQQ